MESRERGAKRERKKAKAKAREDGDEMDSSPCFASQALVVELLLVGSATATFGAHHAFVPFSPPTLFVLSLCWFRLPPAVLRALLVVGVAVAIRASPAGPLLDPLLQI
jgi:hypothetical protein